MLFRRSVPGALTDKVSKSTLDLNMIGPLHDRPAEWPLVWTSRHPYGLCYGGIASNGLAKPSRVVL